MDNKASRTPVKAAKGASRKSPLDLSEAELIRSSLLSKVTGEKTDYRLRVIYAAAMDGRISNASLRHLIFRQMASDWASGKCHTHRQEYFALIEGVTTRSIITAEGQLEDAGYLSIERRRRETSSVSIIAPEAVSALVRSILDVQFSSHQEPEVAVDVKNFSHQGPLDVKEISPVDVKNFSPSKEKREKEDEEEDGERACASEPDLDFEVLKSGNPHPIASEHHFERWHDIGNRWGQTLAVVALNHPVSRAKADQALTAMLNAFAGEPADVLRPAFLAVMAELEGRILGAQKTVGFSAMANYARNTLKTEIAKAKRCTAELEAAKRQADAAAEIKIAKEKTIADQGVAAHAAAVEAGAKIREARATQVRPSTKASARAAAFGVLADRQAARAADPIEQAIAQGGDERILRAG